jgi:Na+-transporting NADH:ubiquinone oxidoreductase subunit NqrA
MSDEASMIKAVVKETLGDRIRTIADQLKQETNLQIKATSRILGAAAQISENHDRLVSEVVEMVEEDLEQASQAQEVEWFTVEQLKRQFKTLTQAGAHFNLKTRTWATLVDKLNEQKALPEIKPNEISVAQRLDKIEDDLKTLQTDVSQALSLLNLILKQVS